MKRRRLSLNEVRERHAAARELHTFYAGHAWRPSLMDWVRLGRIGKRGRWKQ